jgi:hypothetical protein
LERSLQQRAQSDGRCEVTGCAGLRRATNHGARIADHQPGFTDLAEYLAAFELRSHEREDGRAASASRSSWQITSSRLQTIE